MARRLAPTALAAALAASLLLSAAPLAAQNAFRRDAGAAGFNANALARNDDGSTGVITLPFAVNYFGTTFTQTYVNNNGNVTFGSSLATYTPFGLTGATSIPIIAAFFADVDTRNTTSALTMYGAGTVNGRTAFGVNWDGVGYFSVQADKLNIFQLILIDRNDTGVGNFDIEFNYDRILWETGGASGGTNGFGGTPVAVGYSAGTGAAGTSVQLDGSFTSRAMIDGGPNALVSHSIGSNVLGRYDFNVRGGQVTEAPPVPPSTTTPEPTTIVLTASGLVGVLLLRRRRQA